MLGKGKRGVVQVQADKLHKVEAHGALGSLGHVGVQKVGSRLLAALADGVHERHDRGLDLAAKRVEALGGKAALVLVEPNVVWIALGVHELGLMLKLGDDSIHIGLKARPSPLAALALRHTASASQVSLVQASASSVGMALASR